MKSSILACSNFSEIYDPLLVKFGHHIVVFVMILWDFADFGHQFVVFAVAFFAEFGTVMRTVCGQFCGIFAEFRTVVSEHLLSSVVVTILCSLCSIVHLFSETVRTWSLFR